MTVTGTAPPFIEAVGVSKHFSGVAALSDVTLRIGAGEARGLVGENGAGKSTLIAILTGALSADQGIVRIKGEEAHFHRPLDALRNGIGTVYQHSALVPNLSVAQNIELGVEVTKTPLRLLTRRTRPETFEALELVGAADLAQRTVSTLTLAQRQLVAIARACSRGGRMIVFDEPTASLAPAESRYLFDVIGRLRAAGIALLYVTHRLDELAPVVDRITVLRAGRAVAECPGTASEQELVDLMAGHEAVEREDEIAVRRRSTTRQRLGGVIIDGSGLADAAGTFRDVDLTVRRGEIVALVGLPDSGAVELSQVIAGARRLGVGVLEVNGRPVTLRSPAQAIGRGIGYMAGDRKVKGVFPNASVRETIAASALPRVTTLGVIRARRERQLVADLMATCRVSASRPTMSITALSGGNQQKALFARTLAAQPRLIVCEDPTAGVDPPGRGALYQLLFDVVAAGAAVVLNSSDLREVATISDRAILLWRGSVVGELSGDALTEPNLMRGQFDQAAGGPNPAPSGTGSAGGGP